MMNKKRLILYPVFGILLLIPFFCGMSTVTEWQKNSSSLNDSKLHNILFQYGLYSNDFIDDYIISLLGREEWIREQLLKNDFVFKKSKEFSEMTEDELKQELTLYFQDFSQKISQEEFVVQLFIRQHQVRLEFIEEVKKAYQTDFDFSAIKNRALLLAAISLKRGTHNKLIDELFSQLKERVELYGGSHHLKMIYLLDRYNANEELRYKAAEFLEKYFLIDALLKCYGEDLSE